MGKKSIKIAQFSTHESHGGAAKASYRLNEGLQKIDSIKIDYFVKNKDKNSTSIKLNEIENMMMEISNKIQHNFIQNNRTSITNTLFSFSLSDTLLPNLNDYDIINLHWVENFLSLNNLYQITQLNKPIIWTLHDMKPFTGGCHYNKNCEEFTKECTLCPQLKDNSFTLTSLVLKQKEKIFKNTNITIVTPSLWLSKEAKKSKLFSNRNIFTIPYGIDTSIFIPTVKNKAKTHFNIDLNSIVLTFGVMSHKEERKGFFELNEAIKLLKKNYQGEKKLIGLFFGSDSCDNFPIDVINLGHIDDEKTLSLVYSAADIFILPSLEDNLPNTILESMACQTPIVAFDTGGAKDIINNNNGSIVEKGSIKKLYEAIHHMIINENDRIHKGINARKIIEEKYTLHHQAIKYQQLFEKLLNKNFNYTNCFQYSNSFFYPLIEHILNQSTKKNEKLINFSRKYNQVYNQIISLSQSNDKYVIYGYGTIGKTINSIIPNQIIGYVDQSSKNYHPDNLKIMQYNKIIISVLGREKEIISYLTKELNISISKIITIEL